MRWLDIFVLGALLTLAPGVAVADSAPSRGTKWATFSFEVDNLAAFPDRVLLAFQCSSSGGVPVRELAELSPGKTVVVGRRGGDCRLYSMAKADFDAWKLTYKPTHQY